VNDLYPYEILVIVDPRLTEEEVGALLSRLADTMKGLGGEVLRVENWGKRRLTYELRTQREGTYAVIEATGAPATVKEFERQLRLNEQVLRFLTTRVPVRKRARAAAPDELREQPTVAEETV
jgi:small subunit ribosomal protein S6